MFNVLFNINIGFNMLFIRILILNYCFLLLTKSVSAKTVYTPFDTQGLFVVNFTIGNQLCSARMDQSNTEICFYLDTYNVSKAIQPNVISSRTFSTGPGAIVIQEREDVFGFINSTEQFTVRFVHIKLLPIQINASVIFGFGYSSNKNTSFTLQLYDKKIIDYPQYTIIPSYSSTEGRLYFGSIANTILKGMKYKGYCDIVSNTMASWQCDLKYVSYGGTSFNASNYSLVFNVKEKFIFVPENFYLFLEREVLHPLINSKHCSTMGYIFCDCDEIQRLPNLVFHIAEFDYQFKVSYLFSKPTNENNKCFLEVEIDHTTWKAQTFRIGSNLMKYFITTYDFKEKRVTLYSDNIHIKSNAPSYEKIYYRITITLLSIGVLNLLYIMLHLK